MAVARVCVTVINSGVPLGAQIAWLLSTTNGCPLEVTRVEPTNHCAVTHGPFAAGGGGRAHTATAYGAAIVTVASPRTVTRGLGTVGCACPPCEHNTVAPTCTRKPGISDHHQRYFVNHHTRPKEFYRCTFTVIDVNACIIHHDHCAGWTPENNSSSTRGRWGWHRNFHGNRHGIADQQ